MLKTADGSISGSLKVIESLKSKKKSKKSKGQPDGTEWTWKEQVDLVKYSTVPVEQSLLRLDADLSVLAVECFLCLMRYMGDQPLPPETSEVKCVYTILMVSLYHQRNQNFFFPILLPPSRISTHSSVYSITVMYYRKFIREFTVKNLRER